MMSVPLYDERSRWMPMKKLSVGLGVSKVEVGVTEARLMGNGM